jgi:hypothetical protein
VKDATADYSDEFMHAAFVNLPNYASAIVATPDINDAVAGGRPLDQTLSAMGALHG